MSKKELVFIPTPGMGHLISTLEFAKLLTKHDSRISILVIVFQMPVFNSTNLESYVESQSRILDPNRISFLTIPPLLNPPNPTTKNFYSTVIELNKPLVAHALATREPKLNPIAFVLDMLCVTMVDIADNQFNVPYQYILINTFTELETYAVQALVDNLASNETHSNVYPVGPVLALSKEEDHHKEWSIIKKWLDEQPTKSVVFLCFGSMGSFGSDQVKEIAIGLDRSKYRFLWSLRRPTQEGKLGIPSEHEIFEEALPQGFLDRIGNRGKVIGWAPQVSILAHRAIGGFVSHCGWNSILESLWFGVPIATWPLYSEQQMNAFEFVNELDLAVEVKMDYRRDVKTNKANFIVKAQEVESGICKLMNLDEEMREKVNEMRVKSRKSVENGGLSYKALTRFIEDVASY